MLMRDPGEIGVHNRILVSEILPEVYKLSFLRMCSEKPKFLGLGGNMVACTLYGKQSFSTGLHGSGTLVCAVLL